MTSNDQHLRHPSHVDPFDERISAAYERMTPSPEAEERMLAALLDTQSRYEAFNAAQTHTETEAETNHVSSIASPAKSFALISNENDRSAEYASTSKDKAGRHADSSTRRWRIAAVSLAACLALVVIGIAGLTFSNPMNIGESASAGSSSASTEDLLSAPLDDSPDMDAADSSDDTASSASPGDKDAEAGSSDEATENAPGEDGSSLTVGPTPSPDKDVRYPYVKLSTGETLEIAEVDGERVAASWEDIGTPLEEATAYNDLGDEAPCYVHESVEGSPYPYVIAFTNSGEMFFAQPTDATPSE